MNKLLFWLNKLVEWVVGLGLALITIIVLLQVFNRFILDNPLSWPEELSRIIFIFLVFLGGALSSKRKTHIRIDLIDSLSFPDKYKNILDVIRGCLIGIIMYYTLHGGIKIVLTTSNIRLSATNLPMIMMVIPVIIGSFLMMLYSIINVFNTAKKVFTHSGSQSN